MQVINEMTRRSLVAERAPVESAIISRTEWSVDAVFGGLHDDDEDEWLDLMVPLPSEGLE